MDSKQTPIPPSQVDIGLSTSKPQIIPTIVVYPSNTNVSQSTGTDLEQRKIAIPERLYFHTDGRPISVGNLGDFDFDFSNRRKYKGRVLTKRIRNLSHQASKPKMSTDDRRASSDSEVSLMRRFSSILTTAAPPTSPRPASPQSIYQEKPLPDDRLLLQNRLNFHISRLDSCKRIINEINMPIYIAHDRLMRIYQDAHDSKDSKDPEVEVYAEFHAESLKAMRAGRDELKVLVYIHRNELARIREIRVKWNEDAGLGPKVPAIFESLWTDEQWEELFSV